MTFVHSFFALAVLAGVLGAQISDFELAAADRAAAVAALEGLEQALPEPERDLAALHAAAHRVAALLGPGSRHARRVTALLAEVQGEDAPAPTESCVRLRRLLLACREDLAFRPVEEADRPTGFPGFTTIGEIEVKHYPKHRLARTAMPDLLGETRGFWTLFRHIKDNEIAMTAPVEMRYEEGTSELKPLTMAFLYGDLSIGETGRQGDVEVLDIEPATMISMGLRGGDREDRVTAAARELEAFLARHGDRWERAGELRVMGWNGPSVRGNRRYFEVQIPIRAKKKAI